MPVFADYIFYRTYLEGSAAVIPQNDFYFYARKASARIKQYTLDNIGEEIPESVKLCCCELAEALYKFENSKSAGGVTSEKVGDISVSYEGAETVGRAESAKVKEIIYSWLADTGLLCRGGNYAY